MLQYPHVNDSVQMYTLYLTVADNTAGKKHKKTQIKKSIFYTSIGKLETNGLLHIKP